MNRERNARVDRGTLVGHGEVGAGRVLPADDNGRRFLRLSFPHVSEEELTRGIEVLGDALRASVA